MILLCISSCLFCFTETLTNEDLSTLSDVKTMISQLYSQLNVDQHQFEQEKRLIQQLEELKVQTQPYEKVRFLFHLLCVYCNLLIAGLHEEQMFLTSLFSYNVSYFYWYVTAVKITNNSQTTEEKICQIVSVWTAVFRVFKICQMCKS